jgi:hypothetical protein
VPAGRINVSSTTMARLRRLVILLAIWIRPGETQIIYPVLDLAPAPNSSPVTEPQPKLPIPKPPIQAPPKQPAARPAISKQPSQVSGPRMFDSVWAKVRRNVNTECKICPNPLCKNRDWYGSSYLFRTDCYLTGAMVNNTEYGPDLVIKNMKC